MIPIALITGFLGSGKTTFLQNAARNGDGRRIGFVVNEFAAVDIDGSRLELPADKLLTIAGGSIFCRCKVTGFIDALNRLSDISPALDGVMVEASGIADPKVCGKMLEETGLAAKYSLASVVSIVDPGTFHKLLKTLPNIRAQVEAATLVLVNKTDIYDREQIDSATNSAKEINPNATIIETINAKCDVDVFDIVNCQHIDGQYASCSDPNYFKKYVTLYNDVDWPAFRTRVDEDEDVYRVKGFVPTADGMLDVDYSAGRWVEKSTAGRKGGLAIIANAKKTDHVNGLIKLLESV